MQQNFKQLEIEMLNNRIVILEKSIYKLKKELVTARADLKILNNSGLTDIERYKKEYSEDHCINILKTDRYIWDGRYWHRYKDLDELLPWIISINHNYGQAEEKNCGHVVLCIYILLKGYNKSINEIAEYIIQNPYSEYKDEFEK